MFIIENQNFGRIQKIILSNINNNERVEILPDYGGNINKLSLTKEKETHTIIRGSADYDTFKDNFNKFFAGAKITPFPNRVKHANYTFKGKKFELVPNEENTGHALHGLLYNKCFSVLRKEVTMNEAILELVYTDEGLFSGYPFQYQVNIFYKLNGNGFTCTTTIKNCGNIEMPVGDGWHPYFTTGSKVDDLLVKVQSNKYLERDLMYIPTGKILENNDFSDFTKIGNKKFNDCFVLNDTTSVAETLIFDKKKNLTINVWQQTGEQKYNFVQYYVPPSRTEIAVEPMTCAPDAFNNQLGLIYLKPNQSFMTTFGVKLQ